MPREIQLRYDDPLDLIWLACARELGLEIARSSEVYAAFERGTQGPWALAIERALAGTRELARIIRETNPPKDSLWARTRPLHETGFVLAEDASLRCGACAFSFAQGAVLRCRQTRSLP